MFAAPAQLAMTLVYLESLESCLLADGFITVTLGKNSRWLTLVQIIGEPELLIS